MSTFEINYNNVASFEQLKQPRSTKAKNRLFTVVLMAVFFMVLMAGLAVGVSMYQAVANNQLDTYDARMQSGLLASNIHANDMSNALGTGNGPEGRSLVLTMHDADGTAYEMRLYLYQGNVVQEYSLAGAAYTPQRAQKLLASNTFNFQLRNQMLTIFTDQGATNIALRSYQGGAS